MSDMHPIRLQARCLVAVAVGEAAGRLLVRLPDADVHAPWPDSTGLFPYDGVVNDKPKQTQGA